MTVDRAAIKKRSGEVVKAKRKGDAHRQIPAKGKRGFVLGNGKFVGRVAAGKSAKAAGQVKEIHLNPKLHSGDLPARKA